MSLGNPFARWDLSRCSRLRWLAWIALALLGVKLLWLIILKDLPFCGDEGIYFRESAYFFRYYFTTYDFWAPLQTAFLAAIRLVAGDQAALWARLIQLLVHTVTGFIVYLLGRELDDERTGLLAGALYLALPEPVSFAYLLFSETWSSFWFFGSICCYLLSIRRGPAALMAAAGFSFGIAALFRSINLYFLPLYLCHLGYFDRRPAKRRLLAATLFLVFAALPISVQTYKNYTVGGHFLLINTNGPKNLWVSHNVFDPPCWDYRSDSNYARMKQAGYPGARPLIQTGIPSVDTRLELKNALAFMAAHPGLTIRRSLNKIRSFFAPNLFIFRNFEKAGAGTFIKRRLDSKYVRFVLLIPYLLMLALALPGLVFCRDRATRWLFLILILYHLGFTTFFSAQSRYRMAVVPVLAVFMGWSIAHWSDWRHQKSRVRWALVIAGWILMLIALITPLRRVLSI